MFLGLLFMIFWLAIGVAAVVFAARWWFTTFGLGPSRRTPREILDERYARGEIDREEYQRRCEDIAGR
jgi:putative membrane protein